MPNSSRIRANAAARFTPECDWATSTRSSKRQMGSPFCSKWTVTATYALWFGDVHASVPKLKAPSCSWLQYVNCRRWQEWKAYLEDFSDSTTSPCEHLPNVTRNSRRRRYVISRSPCLHQALKSPIIYNREWPHALRYPTDNLCPGFGFVVWAMRIGNLSFSLPLESGGN
jgi:hypothetical protein